MSSLVSFPHFWRAFALRVFHCPSTWLQFIFDSFLGGRSQCSVRCTVHRHERPNYRLKRLRGCNDHARLLSRGEPHQAGHLATGPRSDKPRWYAAATTSSTRKRPGVAYACALRMRTVDVEELEVKTTLENYERKRAAIGGIVAGLVAGLLLALFMLVMNLLARQDIWVGMKSAGIPFLGEAATRPGFDVIPVVVGVATHLAISAAWGLVFGMLFYGLSKIATVLLGALWGVVIWFTMLYVV